MLLPHSLQEEQPYWEEILELESFVTSIRPEDYRTCATPHLKSGLGNPYALCALASVIGVCKFCRTKDLGRVKFFIESGQPNVNYVNRAIQHMQTKERFGIASVTVAKKKDFVQLCTADFVAHSYTSDPEWYQRLFKSGRLSQDHVAPKN